MSNANPIAAMAQINHWIGVRRVPATGSAVCIARVGRASAPTRRRARPDGSSAGDRVYFTMVPFDFQHRTRTIFGTQTAERTGPLARELGLRTTLLVADPGIVAAGHAAAVERSLHAASLTVVRYSDFGENPDSDMVAAGARFAAAHPIDGVVALGGGSSLDCAKGINFLLTNGGEIADYRGYGKAAARLLPMIGIPTTAGTGSEAQSYAVISDAATHMKMACGDPKLAFRVAILDPTLTCSQPASVTVATGFDAMSHAVESFVTAKRSPVSDMLAREAWRLIDGNLER